MVTKKSFFLKTQPRPHLTEVHESKMHHEWSLEDFFMLAFSFFSAFNAIKKEGYLVLINFIFLRQLS